jgi:translation initiation factor IF-2
MSEVNTPRLMAAAKEFNIGTNTLIEFLVSKSFSADDLKPTTKLTEAMYRVLQSEFQQDKAAKQKAEQVDLPKGAGGDPKKKKDEEDLSFKKKEEKPKVVAPPVEETVAPTVVTEVPPTPATEPVAAVEPEKPKVKKTTKKVVIVGPPIIHKAK